MAQHLKGKQEGGGGMVLRVWGGGGGGHMPEPLMPLPVTKRRDGKGKIVAMSSAQPFNQK